MSLFDFKWLPWRKPEPTPEPVPAPIDKIAGWDGGDSGDASHTPSSAAPTSIVDVDFADLEVRAVAQAVQDGELLAPGEGVGFTIAPMESIGRGTGEEVLVPKKAVTIIGGEPKGEGEIGDKS